MDVNGTKLGWNRGNFALILVLSASGTRTRTRKRTKYL